jgi:hypothetical protein
MIDAACSSHDAISYRICKRSTAGLPLVYEIDFHIPSITGVENLDGQRFQKPVFGNHHILRISIPNNYPSADGGYPDFKFVTNVWHPNIRYFGDFKGHVCLNFDNNGTSTTLAEFISKVAAYLRYDDYHALDEPPYPEDQTVAQWVREQAEPKGWLKFAGRLLFCMLCFILTFKATAQEIRLDGKNSRNRETVSVRLYDNNEGNFLIELPLTFHITQNNILFMFVGDDNGISSNTSIWMFDKTLTLNDFLKINKQIVAGKTFKKQISRLDSFFDQSENVEKFTWFDNGFEQVQTSPKPVFFKVSDPSKPVVLKLKFYTSLNPNNRPPELSAEAGIIKITINL